MPETSQQTHENPHLDFAQQRDLGMAMLADPKEAELSMIAQENIRKLELSGDVGHYLLPLYRQILEADPRLDYVILRPFERSDHQYSRGEPGFNISASDSQTEHDEVHIYTGGWREYRDVIRFRPGLKDEVAKKLGVEPSELTEKTFAAFVFAHEFGHRHEEIEKRMSEEESEDNRNSQEATLPVPSKAPSVLTRESRRHPLRVRRYIKENAERLSKHVVLSVKQLLYAQEVAYRALPVEAYADDFAVKMLSAAPEK